MTYYSANCAVIAENDDLADKNLVPLVLLGPDKSVGQEWRDNLYKRAKPQRTNALGLQRFRNLLPDTNSRTRRTSKTNN